MVIRRTILALGLVAAFAAAHAEIRYTVTPDPDQGKLHVTVTFTAKAGPVEMQMPNWSPGAYILGYPGRQVTDFKTDATVSHPSDNTWSFNAPANGRVTVEYDVPNRLSDGAMHFSGPSTYMYVVGRKE